MKRFLVITAALLSTSPAWAAADVASDASPLGIMPMMIVLAGLMYFVLIRPQSKRMKAHNALMSELKTGLEVMTTGGLIGTITAIDGDYVNMDIAKGVTTRVYKQAISKVLPKAQSKS